MRALVLVLIASSTVCFALETTVRFRGGASSGFMHSVEVVSLFFFTLEYVVRLWTCVEDLPNPDSAAPGARFWWAVTDTYAALDLLSILPFYVDLLTPGDLGVHLQWLRMLRALSLLKDSGAGLEVLAKVAADRSQLLLASFSVATSVWLVCSALYHYFDHGNPAMVLCPTCPEPGDPGSCRNKTEQASCFGRMDTIPGAMYFCLLNLFGEFPLMLEHHPGSKVVGVFIAIVGNAIVGIATGVLGNGFADCLEEAEEAAEEASVRTCSKESNAPRGEEESPGFFPVDARAKEVGEALDSRRGPWATLCTFLAIHGVIFFLLSEHTAVGEDSPLSELLVLRPLFEIISFFLFAGEYAVRVALERRAFGPLAAYASSPLGVVDFAAFAPVLLMGLGPPGGPPLIWLVICMARLLKLERYMRAFHALRHVLVQGRGLFLITGIMALVLWVVFSTVMWSLESSNPNPEVSVYYQSIPKAMWMTLLNLSGECPLADYTIAGKFVTGFIGVFAVSVMSVPFGLMSDGFQRFLDDSEGEASSLSQDMLNLQESEISLRELRARTNGLESPSAVAVCTFLNKPEASGWPNAAWAFERLSTLLIAVTVASTLLEHSRHGGFDAQADAAAGHDFFNWALGATEDFTIAWFTLEFVLRLHAAPADPNYGSCAQYLSSYSGVIDLVTVVPFYASLVQNTGLQLLDGLGAWFDDHDEELRLVRVMRLLLLSRYVPSIGVISRVFSKPRIQWDLIRSSYVAICALLLFASLLHLTERGDVEDPEMATRFRSVSSSIPFTLIHLTGDYPLVDYSVPARLVHVFMIMIANGLVGFIGGVVASGFVDELREFRREEKQNRRKAASVLGKAVRRYINRKHWSKLAEGAKYERQREEAAERRASEQSTLMWKIKSGLRNEVWQEVRFWFIVVNVALVVAESVPDVVATVGQLVFNALELASVLVFSAEYLLTLYSARVNRHYFCSRWLYAFSFFGFVDLMTVLPYWANVVMRQCGKEADVQIFRIFRVFRILQLLDFVDAYKLLDDTWARCRETLAASGLMALITWLFGAVLFWELERDNEALDGALSTIPSALHFTAVFLAGEWALVDFTTAGKLLCMFYCLLGIAVFTVPVGCVFEAFEDVLCGDDDQEDVKSRAATLSKGSQGSMLEL